MLRISYEVIKKYRPEAYITTGGVGYPQFVDALMRYTDNPDGGKVTAQYPRTAGAYLDALSFHSYPSYELHSWDTPAAAFKYTRNSDFAAAQVMTDRQAMANVLAKYGYDGSKYPAKNLLLSETNIARRTSEDRTGSDEMQRSFGIKTLVLAQKNNVKQLYFFNLGEGVNAPSVGQSVSPVDEIALMGLYENLTRDAPGSQKLTLLGQAFATTTNLLYGYSYDAGRTATLALPPTVEGAAFNKNGTYRYVLWAKALADNSEYANATYSFPSSLGIGTMQRREWDFAGTNATTNPSAQSISLTATPAFFEAGTATSTPAPTPPVGVSSCAGVGGLWREQWDNVPGATVASIPLTRAPASAALLPQAELVTAASATNYAARLRGYLCPPLSGTYSFWVCADDAAEFWLSSDADPAHKQRLAACQDWTNGPHDFNRYPLQQSAPVTLQAGQQYYLEVLHKQGWGPGYLSLAWLRPDGLRQEPIPGNSLIPFAKTKADSPSASRPALVAPTTTTTATATKARITVTFANAPANAASRLAPTLYNKTRVLNFEEDDSPVISYTDLFPLLQGGSKSSTGQWCNGLRFTDGCGNRYPYTAAVAINGHNPYNNSEWLAEGDMHDASKLTWAQAQTMLNARWDIENHSDLHGSDNPAQQLATLDALISARLQGYKPSILIVPTNFAGYCTAAFAAGYAGASSASQSDNLPFVNQYTDDRTLVGALPAPGTQFVYRRYLADLADGESEWALLNRLKNLSDKLLAPGANSSDVFLQRVFTHNISFNTLSSWLNYTQSIAQDQLWVTTLREFTEYRRVSSEVVKKETLSGNTLTIEIDYANLSPNTRFQNLSLVIDSPGKIQQITVNGADSSSFNPATGLVNIFRHQDTASAPTPAPTLSAGVSGCAGVGGLWREQWDNVPGATVASIPLTRAPSSAALLPQAELVTAASATNYAARLRGYLCPPLSGTYSFWVCADDAAEFWLSSDADPAHKQRLAACQDWTNGPHDFNRYPLQQSAPVTLQAGQQYYLEVLHKQGWGPGYLSLAWLRLDGLRQEPIPGNSLIPFANNAVATNNARGVLTAAPDDAATGSDSLRKHNALSVYPNPFSQQATVQFSVVKTGAVSLTLLSLTGQLVGQLYSGTVAAGATQSATVKADGLRNGLYVLRLVTPTGVLYQKVSCSGQ